MDEQESTRFPVNWTGIVLLIAVAAGGVWWLQSPLVSSRPEEKKLPGLVTKRELLTARLWQDPLEAVQRHWLLQEAGTQAGQAVLADGMPEDQFKVSLQFREYSSQNLLVLPIMVTGSPYVEGAEWRMRSRVALLSGLAAAGFVPADNEHIGYVQVIMPQSNETTNKRFQQGRRKSVSYDNIDKLLMPYEWFRTSEILPTKASSNVSKSSFDRILVLWVAEDLSPISPLNLLARIRSLVAKAANDEGYKDIGLPEFRVVGPWSSTTLKTLYEELNRDKTSSAISSWKGIEFYSTPPRRMTPLSFWKTSLPRMRKSGNLSQIYAKSTALNSIT